MADIKTINDELYKTIYIDRDIRAFSALWEKIKKDTNLLRTAIELLINAKLLGTLSYVNKFCWIIKM